MATTKNTQEVVKEGREGIGTFIGVGIVGAVILVTYIVMYGLYMARV
ncbi:hypothetical protein M670_04971 [Schinkia azotoformans MEV2011]|uniref:Uncharacterized protein n=1 Tax=Schinkia azotoformans MEV2011 TaxID=1348973 RepID=A0A072NDU1_SCHAZ|nr:hypothetical protein [Schinkia azotoformans]KEF35854.1 hypothetical protein M670_04971 [Schinkia azotoformans MEV2011]MEC1696913.1 hypothetical protein [Schinkia azotoformans]MEC1723357.1 hypothetical protein [Schinkia azotoformans]MEC1742964.1 hypothetical protein [Schinkia azotoformans]MEC1745360.1 hypothetical protein [Schinkia azotoformans]